MFFNIWFILFCEIADKWGEAKCLYLSLATSLSKKPLRSVLYCPLKTHLVLFLALGALFGFCIVNQTSSFESLWHFNEDMCQDSSSQFPYCWSPGLYRLSLREVFESKCILRSHWIHVFTDTAAILNLFN